MKTQRIPLFATIVVAVLCVAPAVRVEAIDITGTYNASQTFTGANTWTSGNVTINGAATTVTNLDTGTITYDATTGDLFGGGTLRNEGLFVHATATSADNLDLNGTNTFVNAGTYEFASGGDLRLFNPASVFENTGTILKTTGTVGGSNDPSYIFRNTLTTGGTFVNSGDIEVQAGKLNIAGGSSTGGTFTTSGGGVLSFTGPWTELTGTTAAGSNVRIDAEDPALTTGAKFTAAAATTVINIGGNGIAWVAGTLDTNGNVIQNDGLFKIQASGTKTVTGGGTFRNASGTVSLESGTLTVNASVVNDGATNWTGGNLTLNADLTNNGTFTFGGSGGTNRILSGAGTFINNGDFLFTATVADNIEDTDSGGQFLNNGLFDFQGGGDFELRDGYTFTVASGGVLRKSVAGGDAAVFFARDTEPGAGTLDIQGTIEVLDGEIEVRGTGGGFTAINIAQYNAATKELTGGTWAIRDPDGAGAGSSVLDLQPAGAGIQKIGAAATVELTGPDAQFSQLTGSLNEVAGKLTVNDMSLTIPGTLALTDGLIDGTGTVVVNSNITNTGTSTLDLDGAFKWQNGTLDMGTGTIVNDGLFQFAGNSDKALVGSGTFINNGVYEHVPTGANDNLNAITSGGQFINNGLHDIQGIGDFELKAGFTYTNSPTGIIRKSAGTGNEALFFSFTNPAGTFDNQGTVEVLMDLLEIRSMSGWGLVQCPQYDAGTKALTGGTWIIRDWDGSGGGTSTLDLQPANAGIQVLGAGAAVELTGPGSVFTQLTSHIREVAGTLTVNDRTLTTPGSLTISGGTLVGSGTVNVSGTTTATGASTLGIGSLGLGGDMTHTGTLTWNGGTIDLNGNDVLNNGTIDMVTTASKALADSGSVVNNGTMNWLGGSLALTADLTNNGTFEFGADVPERTLSGSGTFTNNGTFLFTATGATDNIENTATGGEFVNNGVFDFQSIGDFALCQGYTFTNAPGGVLRKTSGGSDPCLFFDRASAPGGGTIDNQGTIEVLRGELEIRSSDDSGFDDITIPQYNSGTRTLTGGTWVIRDPDGSGTSWARLDMHPANAGITTIGAAATVELTGPSAYFPQLTPYLNEIAGILTVNSMTLTTPGGLTLTSGRVDGTGTVAVGGATANTGTSTLAVGTFALGGDMANPAGATLRWEDGTLNIGSHTLVNDGLFQFAGNSNKSLVGTGTFINNGVFEHVPTGTNDNLNAVTSGGTFINNGLHDIKGIGDFELTAGFTYVNSPTGIVRKSAGDGNEALFFSYNDPAGTFDNQGTVEVLMDLLEIRSMSGWGLVQCPQYDAGTKALTGGTWIIRDPDGAGSGDSTLDLQPANAGIVTLGAGAAVELSGPHSVFTQLTGSLATVAGTLTVNARTFTAPTGTLTVSGTIAGTGTYSGDVVVQSGGTVAPGANAGAGIGALTFDGDLALQSGSILEIALNGLADYDQVLFTAGNTLTLDNATLALSLGFMPQPLDEFILVSGFDTLAGAGQFAGLPDGAALNVDGAVFWISYNLHDITLTTAPEPTTLALLGLGTLCLRLRRRRTA